MLWLLCKLLFNDTATEGVLYYLSHCSSLQSRHCISTLLLFFFFLHLYAASDSRKIPVPATKLSRPQLCHYLTALGQILLLQLQRTSASCPARVQLPPGMYSLSPISCHCAPSRAKMRLMGWQQGCGDSWASLKAPEGRGAPVPWGDGWSSPPRGNQMPWCNPDGSYPKQFADL